MAAYAEVAQVVSPPSPGLRPRGSGASLLTESKGDYGAAATEVSLDDDQSDHCYDEENLSCRDKCVKVRWPALKRWAKVAGPGIVVMLAGDQIHSFITASVKLVSCLQTLMSARLSLHARRAPSGVTLF